MTEGLSDFSSPLYRAIMGRDMIAGVPAFILYVLLFCAAFFVFYLRIWLSIPFFVVFYMIARAISAKDEFLLEILFCSLLDPDELRI